MMFFLAQLDLVTIKKDQNWAKPHSIYVQGISWVQFRVQESNSRNTDVGSIWKLMMAFIFCEWSATKKELYPLWSFHIFLFYVSFL